VNKTFKTIGPTLHSAVIAAQRGLYGVSKLWFYFLPFEHL